MTDNRATELLPCPCCDSESIKEFAPDEWGDIANPYWKIKCMECGLTMFGTNRRMNQEAWNTRKPEQAIAATLGSEPPYDELLRCLENDWYISASWDGLRKFWCIELTEEGLKLRDSAHGTLTAEQVREAIEANSWAETSTIREFNDSSWQAIADELNAELGSGTCEPNWVLQGETQTQEFWRCECGNCGECFGVESRESFPFKMTVGKVDVPNFCPNCGKAVKR